MQRQTMLEKLAARGSTPWDIAVIGGGATGLGIAVDAAARGHATILCEQADFAKGTSSRSTKLIHGGVRYLAQGDISLVLEALRERGLLMRNAPHLVHNLPFIIPTYTWWEGPFYSLGMKVYDAMAGKLGLGPSELISRDAALAAIPTLSRDGLRGGVVYHDGQFDDARLAISLAQTAADRGAVLLNYCTVTGILKDDAGMVTGCRALDVESGRRHDIHARVVINATGVFVDRITHLDNPAAPPLVTPSQGVHIVLSQDFLRGRSAIMIPHTDDGRVLFAVPWYDRVIVGTTDTPVPAPSLEPRALESEIDFILTTAARYLTRRPTRRDVLSIFAGLRPLAAPEHATEPTREISRGHRVLVAPSGLITIVGGKWTTYRRMAADVVDKAQLVGDLPDQRCPTESLAIHGASGRLPPPPGPLAMYGSDAPALRELARTNPQLAQPLHPALPYSGCEVVWACREEMARTLEDVLARRTRALLLDARASRDAAPRVAALMAAELHQDRAWQEQQVATYQALAAGYVLD
ncbi:MAG: glycerol-3-phosphate dehydrogenase/oxidase [Lentisphaerae bacterium]|nr:glycerol-3-phosphate dehydrogenase/oxidase [Lentisphaerota bacterium]